MCNCLELPRAIINIGSSWISKDIGLQGQEQFSNYFQEMQAELFEPELDYSTYHYQCLECGQHWYIECSPDEGLSPLFALKYEGVNHQPNADDVWSNKEFLTVLAHDGFENTKCRTVGCENYKLKGRELCHRHLTLP